MIPIKIFPLHPNEIYLDPDEAYFLSWIYANDYGFREKNPDTWKPGKTPGLFSGILEQPFRLL